MSLTEKFIHEVNSIVRSRNGKVISYKNSIEPFNVRCENNHTFEISPLDLFEGEWCEECFISNEKENIHIALEKLDFSFVENKRVDNFYFDFFFTFEDKNYLIAVDSDIVDHDIMKQLNFEKENYITLRLSKSFSKNLHKVIKFIIEGVTFSMIKEKEGVKTFFSNPENYVHLSNEKVNIEGVKPFTIFPLFESLNQKEEYSHYIKFSNFKNTKNYNVMYGYCSDDLRFEFNLANQEREITLFCERENLFLERIYCEKCYPSVKLIDRISLQELSKDVAIAENVGIIFMNLANLSSKPLVSIQIFNELKSKTKCVIPIQNQKDIESVDTKILEDGLLSFDKEKKSLLSIRKKKGKMPFGYKKEGSKIIENDEEQKALNRIKEIKALQKNISLNRLCEILNDEKVKCRKSRAWYPSRLRDILIQQKLF